MREEYDLYAEKGKPNKQKMEEVKSSSCEYILKLMESKFDLQVEVADIWTNWMVVSLAHHLTAQKTFNNFHPFIKQKKQTLLVEKKEQKSTKSKIAENLNEKITNEHDPSDDFFVQSYLYTSSAIGKKKNWWVVCKGSLYKYKSFYDFEVMQNFDLMIFSIKPVNSFFPFFLKVFLV